MSGGTVRVTLLSLSGIRVRRRDGPDGGGDDGGDGARTWPIPATGIAAAALSDAGTPPNPHLPLAPYPSPPLGVPYERGDAASPMVSPSAPDRRASSSGPPPLPFFPNRGSEVPEGEEMSVGGFPFPLGFGREKAAPSSAAQAAAPEPEFAQMRIDSNNSLEITEIGDREVLVADPEGVGGQSTLLNYFCDFDVDGPAASFGEIIGATTSAEAAIGAKVGPSAPVSTPIAVPPTASATVTAAVSFSGSFDPRAMHVLSSSICSDSGRILVGSRPIDLGRAEGGSLPSSQPGTGCDWIGDRWLSATWDGAADEEVPGGGRNGPGTAIAHDRRPRSPVRPQFARPPLPPHLTVNIPDRPPQTVRSPALLGLTPHSSPATSTSCPSPFPSTVEDTDASGGSGQTEAPATEVPGELDVTRSGRRRDGGEEEPSTDRT